LWFSRSNPGSAAEQCRDRFGGSDQPIGEDQQLVLGPHQARNRATVTGCLEGGTFAFRRVLDGDQLAGKPFREADDALAAEAEGDGELMMDEAAPPHPQQPARGRRIVGARLQR
jgi:hypothetical protein